MDREADVPQDLHVAESLADPRDRQLGRRPADDTASASALSRSAACALADGPAQTSSTTPTLD